MTMTRPTATTAMLCGVLLTASGCAGGPGARGYACEGLPSRPLCLSTAEIYALTDHPGPPPAERRTRQEALR
jgi:hypothetical protein